MRLRVSLAIALVASGCTTTHHISQAELTRLNGWRDDGNSMFQDMGAALRGERKDERELVDSRGRKHKFDKDTPLVFFHRDGGEQEGTYSQVEVTAEQFRGVPTEDPSQRVVVPFERVQRAGIRRFSLGNTVLLTLGIAAGALVGLGAVGVALGGGSGSGGGDDD